MQHRQGGSARTSDIRGGERRPSGAAGRPVQNLIYLLARLAATSLHRQQPTLLLQQCNFGRIYRLINQVDF